MRNRNLVVLGILAVLLGMSTGFIVIDFSQFGAFANTMIGLVFTYYVGGPEGDAGTGNGEDRAP